MMAISIGDFIEGVTDGSLSDDEIIEWLKDVYENGMSDSEVTELTLRMRDSGAVSYTHLTLPTKA